MDNANNSIDRTQINLPEITLTEQAKSQLKLITDNDFTLVGKYFRILISGKGCNGFTYSAGFTDLMEEDFILEIGDDNTHLEMALDPFAAFYLQKVEIDYHQDFNSGQEGFVINNLAQKDYHGKFWRGHPDKVPPIGQGLK